MEIKPIITEPSWHKLLSDEFNKPYFAELKKFIAREYQNYKIYPDPKTIFRAFDLCPVENLKVVILGQDPYHGENQANGLAFAVNPTLKLPPSLQNIYKEIASDLKISPQADGDLARWAKQGVLLLNATLTVRAQSPGSHQHQGWEHFTDTVIQNINMAKSDIVYILWGKYAQQKGAIIDETKNLVLKAAHPSPFSAHNGFFGCQHFSKANKYLEKLGKTPIDWS
jgi:uracil-DNA glycosylase